METNEFVSKINVTTFAGSGTSEWIVIQFWGTNLFFNDFRQDREQVCKLVK